MHTGMVVPASDDSVPNMSGPHRERISIFPHPFTLPPYYN